MPSANNGQADIETPDTIIPDENCIVSRRDKTGTKTGGVLHIDKPAVAYSVHTKPPHLWHSMSRDR
ncbi:hypothetical protein CCP3SC1AL1_1420012 [Gammaproteobacteria bacterium]